MTYNTLTYFNTSFGLLSGCVAGALALLPVPPCPRPSDHNGLSTSLFGICGARLPAATGGSVNGEAGSMRDWWPCQKAPSRFNDRTSLRPLWSVRVHSPAAALATRSHRR